MNCLSCGKPIKNKSVEGSDYIRIQSGWHCIECVKEKLSRWPEFLRLEQLAEEASRYREGLISTLEWSINESYCVRPTDRMCKASAEKCLRCWLLYLVGEEMEG